MPVCIVAHLLPDCGEIQIWYSKNRYCDCQTRLLWARKVFVRFPVSNLTNDTMKIYYSGSPDDRFQYAEPVPSANGIWNNHFRNPEISSYASRYNSEIIRIPPRTTLLLDYWVSFSYCGEEISVACNPGVGAYSNLIMTAKASVVVKAKEQPLIGTRYFENEKPWEELTLDSTGVWHFTRWYRDGQVCMTINYPSVQHAR